MFFSVIIKHIDHEQENRPMTMIHRFGDIHPVWIHHQWIILHEKSQVNMITVQF